MIDFQAVKDRVSLVDIASRYTELKKSGTSKELKGPCPFCGGNDRFCVYADQKDCYCRQCDKTWDVVSLFAEKHGLTPVEAAKQLSGGELPETSEPRRTNPKPESTEPDEWESAEWQDKTKKWVHFAHRDLLNETKGKVGRDYLESRGISIETAKVFRIGFIPECMDPRTGTKRPAISLPWVLADGRTCAFKFRFVDQLGREDKDARFSQKKHSDPRLFGGNLLTGNASCLVIEGELNAVAAYQDCHDAGLDVLSFGPEKNKLGQELSAQVVKERGYQRIILWCDSAEKTKAAAAYFEGLNPILVQSPDGLDANNVLVKFGTGSIRFLIEHLPSSSARPLLIPATHKPESPRPCSGLVPGFNLQEAGIQTDPKTDARNILDRLYSFAPSDLQATFRRLDTLLCALSPTLGEKSEAIRLADQIRDWAQGGMLEGKALRAKIVEIFQVREVA